MRTQRWHFLTALTTIAIFLLLAIRPFTLLAESATQAVEAAWQQANDIGQYQFSTEIIQTSRPLPTLANAGKGSRTERLYMEGRTDVPAATMNLKLWVEGGSSTLGQGAIEMQVANGRTLGRVNEGEWQEVDNVTDLFAPDSDPLYFLKAAENITELGTETRAGITFTRYSFDINSNTFARQMRLQMEEQLAQDGNPLPPGARLDIPRLYAHMTGSGEVWIGENGLPLHQIIQLQFPEIQSDQVDVEITTDFTNWGDPVSVTAVLGRGKAVLHHLQPNLDTFVAQTIPYLFLLALSTILLFNRRRAVRAILAGSLSFIMIAMPVLHGQRVYAFNQKLSQAQAEQAATEKANAAEETAGEAPAFNPSLNPLAGVSLQTTTPTPDPNDSVFYDDGLDEDDDGITNAQETEFYGTDPRNADSDGDTLSDGVEINELGTHPLNADSDGDNLPDWAEVQGIVGADSRRWYLDPLAGDSSGGGEADGIACHMTDTNNDTVDDTLVCPDTDGDNVPDVFDLDNDNDGVPDTVDSAPFTVIGDATTGLQDKAFHFDLDNVTANEPIYVDFQLRPTNPDHLWYSLSKLDWPENDRSGQVQSMLNTPFKDNEPGDMRLVPMLEIEMSGTPLPLPLTNPQTSLSLSGSTMGTAVFIQQGSHVELSLALTDTKQYTTAVYNATCGDITSSTTAAYTLGTLGDGDTAVINNIALSQTIADGSHSLRLEDANGNATCQAIPNIINGAYSDQMVDLAALQPYGIAVREKDNAGALLVYVPLVLLYEEAGNSPVAFTGRMFYQPGQADFGAAEQARLAWMVMMRTDRCLPMPDDFDPDPDRTDETEAEKVQAWCSDTNNWVDNGPSVVHAYFDDWRLTGLSVQRNLGFKTAVVFEDPTYTAAQPNYDPAGFNDDNLWSLALGLDASFMAGRSDSSDIRDLTIEDIAGRWDKNSNGSSTAAERWNLPQNAFIVQRYDFPDPSGLAVLAQTHAYDILETHFTTQAIAGGIQDPTLLFLQENRMRSISLDYSDLITSNSSNSLTLDVADSDLMPEVVVAGMNWVPYRFNGSWQPYDIEQYWVDKGADMDAALALTPDWTEEDVIGASFIARAYYVALASGFSQIVEIGGLAAHLPFFLADAEMPGLLTEPNPLVGKGTAIKNVVIKSLNALAAVLGKEVFAGGELAGIFGWPTVLQDTQATLLQNKRGAINLGSEELTPASLAKAYGMDSNLLGADSMAVLKRQARWSDGLGYASTVFAAAAAVTGFIAAGVAFFDENAALAITVVSNTLAVVGFSLQIASLVLKLKVVAALNNLTTFGQTMSHFTKLANVSKGTAVFFVIGQLVSLGLFIFSVVAAGIVFGSLAFDQMLADFIAGVVVAVILLAISAIPVIGQIIAAIVFIIDLIIITICSLVPSENDTETGKTARDYLCGGITGLLTKLVSWLIYDQTPLIKLDKVDRLNLTNFEFALSSPEQGYSSGNRLYLSTDVQSALYRNDIEDITDVSPFSSYRFQFTDTAVKETTMVYTMTTSTPDIHESLSTGSMSGEWQPPTIDGFASDSNFVLTRSVNNNGNVILRAGVNHPHELWLSEGQAYNVQECALVAVPACWLRTEKDTQHLNLSEVLIFDVFPATVDELRQLAAVGGGFALGWDSSFPVLQDADGDGLISSAFGGADPDDGTPDYDGDGLPDFYELQQSNTDPRHADSDNDGLCDDQEVRGGTDPNRADTDSDGLIDRYELFHQDLCDGDNDGDTTEWLGGWDFVYSFNGTTPLTTRVIPSPFTVNPDGDAYLDSLERVYGFNPNVPSSGGILNLRSQLGGSNIIQPGTTLSYTAELENALRTNFALGLLEVEFDAAVTGGNVDPVAFNLAPVSTITTTGQVTIDPSITQSQEITMTNRAGALIVDPLETVDGRSLWLRLNDSPAVINGRRTFADDSLNNWEASCPVANCPTTGASGHKNGGLTFGQNQYLEMPGGLSAIGLRDNGFTVDLWLNATNLTNFNLLTGGTLTWQIVNGDLRVQLNGTPLVWTTSTPVATNQWNHLTWRYDGFNNSHTFFVNGTAVHNQTYDLSTLLSDNASAPLTIDGMGATAASAVLDEYAVYPFPLPDSAIAAIGHERVFYLRGETALNGTRPVSIQDDSAYQNTITCEDITGNESCPSPQPGSVDNSYEYNNSGSSVNTLPLWVQPSPNLDISGNNGAFTIAAWLYPAESPGIAGSGYVMGYGSNSSSTYRYPTLRVAPNSGAGDGFTDLEIRIGIENEAGNYCYAETVAEVPDSLLWKHVSVTFDGLHFTLYVNGQPVPASDVTYSVEGESGAVSDCQGVTPRSESQFYLGGFGTRDFDDVDDIYSFNGTAYAGSIDELHIFNYALDGKEIGNLYWDELPILDLRLDEPPASDVFTDRGFSGFDASCALAGNACPFTGLPGRDNQTALFDGSNDVLAMAGASQMQMVNSSFTLAGWLNQTGAGTNPIIGSDAANTLFFGLGGGSIPELNLAGTTISGGSAVPTNAWHHLAARYLYDANNGSGVVTLFVDGTAVYTQTAVTPLTTGVNLHVGRETSNYFAGYLDRVAVYRGALSNADILNLTHQVPRVNLHLDDAFGATGFANAGDAALSANCTGAACPQADIKGRVYQAVTLDGADDVITIPESGDLLDFNRFSVGMWVMPTQQKDAPQTLVSKGIGSSTAFDLHIAANSMRVGFTVGTANCTTQATGTSIGSLTENVWNHVMLVYNDNQQEARLYINGSLDQTVTAVSPACQNDSPVLIGANGGDAPFAGGMDEIVLYPDELSSRDVADLFSYQLAWFDTSVGHQLLIDADRPTVTLNVSAPYLPNADKVLSISASDPTSEIVSVEVNVNSSGWQAATPDVKAWLFTFVPSGSGLYTVAIRATDEAGNVGTTTSTIAVDGEGPVLGPVNVEGVPAAPAPYDPTQDAWAIDLSGTVTAADSPLDAVTVDLFDDLGASISGRITTTVSADQWQLNYPFSVQPNGVYTVSVQALDLVGNISTREVPANIDGTPPDAAITFTGASNFLINHSVTLSGVITDTGQIVSGVKETSIAFHEMGQNDASAVPRLPGLVLYLPLNEASDPASGNPLAHFGNQAGLLYSQYAATCTDCPANGRSGYLGNALAFDGVDDRLQVNGLGAELAGSALTLSAWVYPEAVAGQGAFLTLGANSAVSRQLLYDATNQTFAYADSGGQSAAAGTFAPGQWYQVTAVLRANGSGTLYVNGTAATTFTAAGHVAPGHRLLIGSSSGKAFQGLVDDVAVLNEALTAAQAHRLYRAAFPVLNVSFDDSDISDGALVQDASRFGHTAVFHGGDLVRPEPGIVGSGAFRFDGSNWIELAGNAVFDLSSGEFTQTAWVYPQNGGPVIDSVSSDADLNSAYPFLHVSDTQVTVGFGDGSSLHSYTSGDILTPNTWNFVAVTFDGTTYAIYVNGRLQESTPQFDGLRPFAATRFNIGYHNVTAGSSFYSGQLDELAIYRQTLTAEQIGALWHQGWQPATLDNSGAGVATTAWHYPLPDGLRGSYQIRLRTRDVNDNGSLDHTELEWWEGQIDANIHRSHLPLVMNGFASLPDLVVSNVAAGGGLSVTLENQGAAPVTDEFWVDVYLNPITPPTAVNQTWDQVGTSGLVWGVTAGALPLNPGQSLTLTVGDAYYRPDYSQWGGIIPPGTTVYAQVDSANAGVSYGAVRETHEATGAAYNNIAGPVIATSLITSGTGSSNQVESAPMTRPRP